MFAKLSSQRTMDKGTKQICRLISSQQAIQPQTDNAPTKMKESELPQLWATLRSSLFTPKTPVHVQKQLVELFAQDSRVIYLPTGAIYRGQHEITSLLKTVASGMASVVSNVVDGEKYALELMSSVSGFDKVQRGYSTKERCVATLVHDNEIAWLLPDVQPTNKRIVVPLVRRLSLILAG